MKRLALLLLVLTAATGMEANAAATLVRPYNPDANASAEIQAAFAEARQDHKPVLIFFGANWCPDCRALAKALSTGKNAALVHRHFNVVKVDVGNFDRNLDVAARYGDPIKKGIPAAVILSPEGKLVYATRAGELANARTMNDAGIYAFFEQRVNGLKSGG